LPEDPEWRDNSRQADRFRGSDQRDDEAAEWGLRESYGLGWSLGDDGFGHGGAYNNAMGIKPSAARIVIFMVQQDGAFGTPAGETIMPMWKGSPIN
jgi:CubicO group peptidase (beta-lactamase class C family)